MTTIKDIVSEILEDNQELRSKGLINEGSLYQSGVKALRNFGMNIAVKYRDVFLVKNGKVILPENFLQIHHVQKCEPLGLNYDIECKKYLQKTMMWTERTEHTHKWETCTPCCIEESSSVITEKLWYDECEVTFYYNNICPIRIRKGFYDNVCSKKCPNLKVKDSPYEMVLNGRTLNVNFNHGHLVIEYLGMPQNNEDYMLPDTSTSALEEYIEAYIYVDLYKRLVPKKEPSAMQMLQYYTTEKRTLKRKAEVDIIFTRLEPEHMDIFKVKGRKDMARYEVKLGNNIR